MRLKLAKAARDLKLTVVLAHHLSKVSGNVNSGLALAYAEPPTLRFERSSYQWPIGVRQSYRIYGNACIAPLAASLASFWGLNLGWRGEFTQTTVSRDLQNHRILLGVNYLILFSWRRSGPGYIYGRGMLERFLTPSEKDDTMGSQTPVTDYKYQYDSISALQVPTTPLGLACLSLSAAAMQETRSKDKPFTTRDAWILI